MSKVIKLTQQDLEKIVQNIVNEQEWKGSTDPEIMQLGQVGPEEIPGGDSYDDSEDGNPSTDPNGKPIELAINPVTGEYFAVPDEEGDNPDITQLT